MMKDFFLDKVEYNHNANQKWIQHLHAHRHIDLSESLKMMSHILNAHHNWNHRILKRTPRYGIWDMHPSQELEMINDQLAQHSSEILKSLDLEELIAYKNSSGASFQNTISEILYHVINHGTYHRGQLSLQLSTLGLPSFSTDYIFYKR
jgi:uncharacterized damage-inducible protein DinB